MTKARIAVVGAELMGHGIAQAFARAGHDVTIFDAAEQAALRSKVLQHLKAAHMQDG